MTVKHNDRARVALIFINGMNVHEICGIEVDVVQLGSRKI